MVDKRSKKQKELDEQIATMRKLGFTEAEIVDVIAKDAMIDANMKIQSLPKDKEKISKEFRATGTSTPTKKSNITKKVDDEKVELLKILMGAIDDKITIINDSREFSFDHNGSNYKVTLTKSRG